MDTNAHIKADVIAAIEAASVRLGLAPRTICGRIGKGGDYIDKLRDPKHQIFPSTADRIISGLDGLQPRKSVAK